MIYEGGCIFLHGISTGSMSVCQGDNSTRRAEVGKGGQRYQSNGIACKSTKP